MPTLKKILKILAQKLEISIPTEPHAIAETVKDSTNTIYTVILKENNCMDR